MDPRPFGVNAASAVHVVEANATTRNAIVLCSLSRTISLPESAVPVAECLTRCQTTEQTHAHARTHHTCTRVETPEVESSEGPQPCRWLGWSLEGGGPRECNERRSGESTSADQLEADVHELTVHDELFQSIEKKAANNVNRIFLGCC